MSKETTSTTPELRRELAKWAFWGTITAALIGASASIAAALIMILPQLSPLEYSYFVDVKAATYPFATTNVIIEKGDDVQIIVRGTDPHWDCAIGRSGPEGMFEKKEPANPVPSGNICELIGYIRPGAFFRVGAYKQFYATESGTLYLGANDTVDWYKDNTGTLVVEIVVRKRAR